MEKTQYSDKVAGGKVNPSIQTSAPTIKDSRPDTPHVKYRPDIDGLRAVAVLAVVGFHAFPNWVSGGFVGVDIFFVISGFLISTIIFEGLDTGRFSFLEFYSRRVKRIFPALLLVLVACLSFGWALLLADEYAQLGKHVAGGAGFVSNLVLWNESGYFDGGSDKKPLLHLWSLGIEEQFYIVWPLLLWAFWKRRVGVLTVTLLIFLASFGLNIAGIAHDPVATFYSPLTRFWELLCGSLLAWLSLKQNAIRLTGPSATFPGLRAIAAFLALEGKRSPLRNALSIGGALLIAVVFLLVTKEKAFPGWWALPPTLGAALLIAAGPEGWVNRVLLARRTMVFFGLISFPLYLWHWPLLSFVRIVVSEAAPRAIRVAAVLLAIALAWVTYKLIEKPLRFGGHGYLKSVVLASLMAVVGWVGYGCFRQEGFPYRFPDIVNVKYDYKAEYRSATCFLDPDQAATEFAKCADHWSPNPSNDLLWGDSHAAHLYPGLKVLGSAAHNLIQRTASSCPPILGMTITNRIHCKQINDYVLREIALNKPRRVILAAVWTDYDWRRVESTVDALKESGVQDILLVGPVPQWTDGLPRQLWRFHERDVPQHRFPLRMDIGLNIGPMQIDPLLADFSRRAGIGYFSPINLLCDAQGCLTRIGDSGDALMAWDYGHLTTKASVYLVSRFPKFGSSAN